MGRGVAGRGPVPAGVEAVVRRAGQSIGRKPWSLWWRSTRTETATAAQTSRLFHYSEGELRLWLDYDASGIRYFQPSLPVLGPKVGAANRWAQSGTLFSADGASPYTATGTLGPVQDPTGHGRSCQVADLSLTVAGTPRPAERLVLCEGAGLVGDGPPTPRSSAPGPYRSPPVEPVAANPPADPRSWRFTSTPVRLLPWSAETERTVSDGPVELTAGGVVITTTNNGRDVVGVLDRSTPAGPTPGARSWVAHPGGRVASVVTVGRRVIVSTSQRTVAAYDEHGRWLWSQRQPDVALAGTRPVGNDLLASALQDGTVEVRALTDGSWRWSTRLDGTATAAPAADLERSQFSVLDDSGAVTTFDSADPRPRRQQELPIRRGDLAAVDGGVAVRSDGLLSRLGAGPDSYRWQTYLNGQGSVRALGPLVLAVSDGTLLAFDSATGHPRWQVEGVDAFTGQGAYLITSRTGELTAWDQRGQVVARTPAGPYPTRMTLTDESSQPGVLVSGSQHTIDRWGP